MIASDARNTRIRESLFAFARRSPFDGDLSAYIKRYSKNLADSGLWERPGISGKIQIKA